MYNSDSFFKKNNLSMVFPYDNHRLSLCEDKNDSSKILSAFTIDDEETYDNDDAITVMKTPDGFRLYVHITNFSNHIQYKSVYDEEAKKRINTIYTPVWNFDLYSRDIVDQISLREGKTRETISVRYDISNYEIIDYKVLNCTIKVEKNYSYKEFDEKLKSNKDLEFLNIFANELREKRIQNADFSSFNEQLSISEKNKKLFVKTNDQLVSFGIVSELMILANKTFSDYTIDNSIPAIYRSQSNSDDLEVLEIPADPPISFYKNVSPVEVSTEYGYHFGLGVSSYLQLSSPIRRYSDSILMRQLDNWLKNSTIMFSENELTSIIKSTKEPVQLNKNKSRNNHKFWALKLVEENNFTELSGYVYSDSRNQYVIYFHEFGFFHAIKKIDCKRLYKIKEEIKISYNFIDPNALYIDGILDIP